jgi:hypothetical protein
MMNDEKPLRLPLGYPEATFGLSGRQPVGTRKPPSGYPEATLRLPSGYPEANQRLSDLDPTNRKCLELGHMGERQKEEKKQGMSANIQHPTSNIQHPPRQSHPKATSMRHQSHTKAC